MIALLLLGCSVPTETGKTAQPTDTGGDTDTGILTDSDSAVETGGDSDTAPPPPDADGDGSPDDEDCAPDDPTVGTTIRERYLNGVDDDCDGVVDEALGEDDADSTMFYQPVLIVHASTSGDVLVVAYQDDGWNDLLGTIASVVPVANAVGADGRAFPDLLGGFPSDFEVHVNGAGDIDGDGVADVAIGGGKDYTVDDPSNRPWMGAVSGLLDATPYSPEEIPWVCSDEGSPGTSDLIPFGAPLVALTACDFSFSTFGVGLFERSAFSDGVATTDEAWASVAPPIGSVRVLTDHPTDVDGDGGPDLVLAYQNSDSAEAALWVVLSSTAAPGIVESADLTLQTDSVLVDGVAAADVDGDGHPDLIVTEIQDVDNGFIPVKRVYLDFASRDTWALEDSTSQIDSPEATYHVGEARNVGDRDGDGRDDVLLTSNYSRDPYGGSDIPDTVAILPGAVLATPGTWSYDDALFRIDGPPDDNLFYPFVDADLDGSGYTDLVLRTNSPHWVEGAGAEVDGASLIFYDPGVL